MNRNSSNDTDSERPRLCCSARLAIVLAGFTSVYNLTHIRIFVSFAMVCMVKATERNQTENPDCPDTGDYSHKSLYEFEWSSGLRGHLISGAFYGFLIGPFVGGYLSYRYGGKRVLISGMIGAGVTHVFLPEVARVEPQIFFVIRIVSGFFGGFILPAFYDVLGHWVVQDERQLLVGGALAGVPFASFTNFPAQGLLCSYLGWASTFYASTIWLISCGIAYFFWIYDYPDHCPFIKEEEKEFLTSKIQIKNQNLPIPWRKMFSSMPIISYIITHFGVSYGFITILLTLPLFMKDVHRLDLQSNGMLSGLPFIGAFFCRIIMSFFFEKIRKKFKVTKNFLRKTFIIIGLIVITSSLLAVTLLTCAYRYVVLGCFVLCVIGVELTLASGYLLTFLDMCPSYTNLISGISNAIANLAGLLGPVIAGLVTVNGENWNWVFYSCIAVFAFSYIFYLFFGKSERLPWDKLERPRSIHRESTLF